MGDYAKAKAAFERALAIDPAQPLAKLDLGNALVRLGGTVGAIAAYKAFLTATPRGVSAEQVRRILVASLESDG